MKIYRYSMILIMVIAAVVAVLTTIQLLFDQQNLYGNIMVVLLACYCIFQVICLFTRKFTFKNIGFFLVHLGIVLFLAGAFIFKIAGINITYRTVPIENVTYPTIVNEKNEFVDLGFQIGFTDFRLTKYDPVYDLYEKGASGKWEKKVDDVAPDEEGMLDFSRYGKLNRNVFDGLPEGETQYQWKDNIIVHLRQPDKYYEVDLIVSDADGGNMKNHILAVNKPFRRNGWIVYLMSYSPDLKSISVLFKYDPAEYLSLAGIWIIIVGTFIMCFYKKRRNKEA